MSTWVVDLGTGNDWVAVCSQCNALGSFDMMSKALDRTRNHACIESAATESDDCACGHIKPGHDSGNGRCYRTGCTCPGYLAATESKPAEVACQPSLGDSCQCCGHARITHLLPDAGFGRCDIIRCPCEKFSDRNQDYKADPIGEVAREPKPAPDMSYGDKARYCGMSLAEWMRANELD